MRLHPALRALSVAVLAACAGPIGSVPVDEDPTPRLTKTFTGQPYSFRHINAYRFNRSPSNGLKAAGGTIAGTVCGTDIQYEVNHAGDRVRVSGFVNHDQGVNLIIREANNIRRIQGVLGNLGVDVLIADGVLAGSVGRCRYEMHANDDAPDVFVEPFKANGFMINLRINGRHELEEMPAADQAALVPLMLRCATAKMFENLGHQPPDLGFGGAASLQPPKTINFGPQSGITCG